MRQEVLLPKLGFSMTEGTLAQWLVADGATVREGDPLYAIEADKSTQEVESPASGTIEIVAEAGSDYPVGTVLAYID